MIYFDLGCGHEQDNYGNTMMCQPQSNTVGCVVLG